MKPKDLPFTIKSFSLREPSLRDRVLTIPSFYTDHNKNNFPELDEIFKPYSKIRVEICSGNGEWIAEKAAANPEIFYVAIEKKFMRVRKIWSKMKNRDLSNLLIVSGMGEDFFNYYVNEGVLDAIYINFPDPWPKARHAKHRIIKPSFLQPIYRALKPAGSITVTTDSDDYSKEIIDVFNASDDFESAHPTGFTILSEEYGGSYFRRLWAEMGRENKLIEFRKTEVSPCVLQKI